METTNNHILESVALDLCPVLDFVRGDILSIACHIVRGIRVSTLGTDGCHQLVILIGDEVLRSQLTYRVDLMISLLTLLRISHQAIFLITLLYLVEQRSLSLRVIRAKQLRTLKHQVLKIVSQTCCLCRIILRTSTYCDVSLYTWLLRISREIHLQTIVEGVDPRLHHVTWYSLILVLFSLCVHPEHHKT